jgi:predicted secreted protein
MTVTGTTSAVGTQLKRGDGASAEAFTALAEVNSITNTKTRETIDATTLDSTGGYMEFIASFRDGGEYTMNLNWSREAYEILNGDYEDDNSVNYQMVMPDTGSTTYDFTGFVTSLGKGASTKDKITMDCTIKVTGQETMTS